MYPAVKFAAHPRYTIWRPGIPFLQFLEDRRGHVCRFRHNTNYLSCYRLRGKCCGINSDKGVRIIIADQPFHGNSNWLSGIIHTFVQLQSAAGRCLIQIIICIGNKGELAMTVPFPCQFRSIGQRLTIQYHSGNLHAAVPFWSAFNGIAAADIYSTMFILYIKTLLALYCHKK